MEYNHEQAVADRVNVDFDVYRIRTLISEHGSTVNAGFEVDKRDRLTRKVRWEKLDDDLTYGATQLDRDVVAPDQIRTIIRTFKERLFTEIFPGRTEVPKTLIFAKDDSHADDIVQIVREEFGKGNDFAQKITYRTGTARRVDEENAAGRQRNTRKSTWVNSGIKAEDLLSSFRNSYNPRIAVTVDMIATGTDIKPLEIVFFMRDVHSRLLFEQMKGRGARDDSRHRLPGGHARRQVQDPLRHRGRDRTLAGGDERHPAAGAQEDGSLREAAWKPWPSAAATRMCSVPSPHAWRVSTMNLRTRTARC